MPLSTASDKLRLHQRPDKLIWWFLIFWTILNAIQAFTLEIHADEAYYWLYSRFLDWGYYDHPPMVAVFIRVGYSLLHNELGLRLMTVLTSTLSLYVLWLILKKYTVDAKWYILIVSGIFIFHIYGFTTTPDAPLFLFTVLFYFVYQKYLEEDSLKWSLLLAVVIALLLYSKYHGILLVGFTVLSNINLVKRKTFWGVVVLSLVLYIPHIIWQINHNFPSINYHLFERSNDKYNFEQTILYIPGQLMMAGPVVGWFLFYAAFKTRVKDAFIRCLMVNCLGTYLFFFINTLKGEVQPHWTLIAFVPLIMLSLIYLRQRAAYPRWLFSLAIINISLIIVVRVSLIFGAGFIRKIGQLKSSFGFKEWAYLVHQKAGDAYVVMTEGFQNPSKYDFYNNTTKGFSYDSKFYRRTQFDMWPIEDSLQHKRVYYLTKDSLAIKNFHENTDTISIDPGTWYGVWIDDFRSYQKVTITPDVVKLQLTPGQKKTFDLLIDNPYPFAIDFSSKGRQHELIMAACMFKDNEVIYSQKPDDDFYNIVLKPGQQVHYHFTFTAPQLKGKYDLLFSLRTKPFAGSKNSKIIVLVIK